MGTRYTSRLEKIGTPLWVRGLAVVMLAVIVVADLAIITLIWTPHSDARKYVVPVFLSVLSLVALVLLACLWRAQFRGRGGRGAPESR